MHHSCISIRSYALSPVPVEVMAGYLHKRFSTIKWREGSRPTPEDVLRLAALANGDFTEADEVVSVIRDLPPSNYDDVSEPIFYMASSSRNRFQDSGLIGEMERSIFLDRISLALRPSGHPEQQYSLNNLGASLQWRYRRSESAADLAEAISLGREAQALRPPGHPDRHHSCYNLAGSLHDRFQNDGLVDDLEAAIALAKEAVSLRPAGHELRRYAVYNQRLYLYDLFKITGEVECLQEAIALAEEALSLYPEDDVDHLLLLGWVSTRKMELAEVMAGSGWGLRSLSPE